MRLIDHEGEHVGVVPVRVAQEKAVEVGLDLVEVSDKSKPHVCRIMDYGQYKYEIAKKQKEARKKQSKITVKEVKLRPRIGQHDYDFKLNNAKSFLDNGDKVRFILQFRGREMAHKDLGLKVMRRVIEDLGDVSTVEQAPRQEGRFMNMTLTPTAKKESKESKSKEPAQPAPPSNEEVKNPAPIASENETAASAPRNDQDTAAPDAAN